jgi:hypothetical protein
MYLPVLIRASRGFSASSGMAQYEPIFVAPGIRPPLQRSFIHLAEMFHFSAVCLIERYAIIVLLVAQKGIISQILLYSKLRGNQSSGSYLLPKILRTSLIGKQCSRATFSKTDVLKTCWDIPKPLLIIAGDGYAFLRNAIQELTQKHTQNPIQKRHRIAARWTTIR